MGRKCGAVERRCPLIRLIDYRFNAKVELNRAWDMLTKVTDWPTWATHIKSATLAPPGSLTAESSGTFRLALGVRSTFAVDHFEPPNRWRWTGPLTTMKIHYDHIFESIAPNQTAFRWTVDASGIGSRTMGRLFAIIYKRNLAAAAPRLIKLLETCT